MFVGYPEHSKRYRLYDPVEKIIIESRHVKFIEDRFDCNEFLREKLSLEETKESEDVISQVPVNQSESVSHKRKVYLEDTRRSERLKKPSSLLSSSEFYTYAGESFERIRLNEDLSNPIINEEAIVDIDAKKWRLGMQDKISSMYKNGVWRLVNLVEFVKPMGCK